jgi:hypothetical protein
MGSHENVLSSVRPSPLMPDRLVLLRTFLRRRWLRWLLIEFMLMGALQFARTESLWRYRIAL